jgi:drug/metabolite transporter (DMT)-like permease
VGVVGGGLAFVLFFDGLAQSEPTPAAFWRDTLVLWVAVLAVLVLRERLRWWNLAAIALLISGEVVASGGVGQLAANRGELDVLAVERALGARSGHRATAPERLEPPATLAVVRMGLGALTLIAYLAASGSLGQLGCDERRPVALGALDRPAPQRLRGDVDERARARAGR